MNTHIVENRRPNKLARPATELTVSATRSSPVVRSDRRVRMAAEMGDAVPQDIHSKGLTPAQHYCKQCYYKPKPRRRTDKGPNNSLPSTTCQ